MCSCASRSPAPVGRGVDLDAGRAGLPTMREVAVALRIDLNTVQRAYAELEREGVLTKLRGVGTFVTDTPPPAPRHARKPTPTTSAAQRGGPGLGQGIALDDLAAALDHGSADRSAMSEPSRLHFRRRCVVLIVRGRTGRTLLAQVRRRGRNSALGQVLEPADRAARRRSGPAALGSPGITAAARRMARPSAVRRLHRLFVLHHRPNGGSGHESHFSALVFRGLPRAAAVALATGQHAAWRSPIALALIGVFLGYSIKMAQQRERGGCCELGKLQAVQGAGAFSS